MKNNLLSSAFLASLFLIPLIHSADDNTDILNASLCHCIKKPSACNTALTVLRYAIVAGTGAMVGFTVSALAASYTAPHTLFPTAQEYFTEVNMRLQYLGYYSSIIVPTSAAVAGIGLTLYDYWYWRKNRTMPGTTETV